MQPPLIPTLWPQNPAGLTVWANAPRVLSLKLAATSGAV
jgi:hypothetical protein